MLPFSSAPVWPLVGQPCAHFPCKLPRKEFQQSGSWATQGRQLSFSPVIFMIPFHLFLNVLPCYKKPRCVCLHGLLLGSSSVHGKDLSLPQCLDCALNGLGAGAQDGMEGAPWATREHQLPSLLWSIYCLLLFYPHSILWKIVLASSYWHGSRKVKK